jgi:prephenate dehydratase
MKLGYLGPEGTFSHQAALGISDGNTQLVQFTNISDVIEAVANNKIDKGMVPIENSIEGTVNQTIDTILKYPIIKIEGDSIIPINHCLVAKKQQEFVEIRTIVSHIQALAQCRNYINKNFKNSQVKEITSTAAAAREIFENDDIESAAISSKTAAQIYGLTILDENIQDESNNETRFLILSHQDAKNSAGSKTSVILSTLNRPGSLYHILGVFSALGINLTKIESRPARTCIGEYIFWIDFEGHVEDEHVVLMIEVLKKMTTFLRILGSYQTR